MLARHPKEESASFKSHRTPFQGVKYLKKHIPELLALYSTHELVIRAWRNLWWRTLAWGAGIGGSNPLAPSCVIELMLQLSPS